MVGENLKTLEVLGLSTAVGALKAAAEPTRLRMLVLLAAGRAQRQGPDAASSGQSQPRISRHLKLLAEAGLVERAPEGSWVYFRLAEARTRRRARPADPGGASIAADPVLVRDRARAEAVRERARRRRRRPTSRRTPASGTASAPCTSPRREVEAAVSGGAGARPVRSAASISAPARAACWSCSPTRYRRGIGLDLSPAMLAYARAKLERAGIAHAQVRQGDIYDLPLADQSGGCRRHAPGAALPERSAARHPRGGARAGAGRAPADRRLRAARAGVPARAVSRTSGWASPARRSSNGWRIAALEVLEQRELPPPDDARTTS